MAGSFMAQRGPSEQTVPRVRRRQVHDRSRAMERRGCINGPSVGAEIRVTPFDQRGQYPVVGQLEPGAVLGAEETVVEVAYHFFEPIGRDRLEAFPLLQGRLGDMGQQPGSALSPRIALPELAEALL